MTLEGPYYWDGEKLPWQGGEYDVYMWWPPAPVWATNVPVDITHDNGTDTVVVDETVGGGAWFKLGTWWFSDEGIVKVRTTGTIAHVAADAVVFVPKGDTPPTEVIIDNEDAECTFVGTWQWSNTQPNRWGPSYHHDQNLGKGIKTATFTPTLISTGQYRVYMWWPDAAVYDDTIPVDIVHDGGTSTVYINEKINGGQWNLLGTYTFTAGTGSVTIRTTGTDEYVIADAVRFMPTGGGAGHYVIDNLDDPPAFTFLGSWLWTTFRPGYWLDDYVHDQNTDKGNKWVQFTAVLPAGHPVLITLEEFYDCCCEPAPCECPCDAEEWGELLNNGTPCHSLVACYRVAFYENGDFPACESCAESEAPPWDGTLHVYYLHCHWRVEGCDAEGCPDTSIDGKQNGVFSPTILLKTSPPCAWIFDAHCGGKFITRARKTAGDTPSGFYQRFASDCPEGQPDIFYVEECPT